ncbi:hypothetical protein [Microbulbifer sp. YPW16]|uniref:hypothetical protein n=1 Tax=Microbulbifer sp. YPW16 TaxID=2904242 RepID=UPI001E61EEFC|nr:hypothetical protein [Microbulbifer sp. YPW16]UHQ54151.1 hypothetical protein LVE68_11540 [Microbulbifer sp. YPW16]
MNGTKKDRGSTNTFTGATSLLDIPANELFGYAIKDSLPKQFLPSFVHESSHFWCLATELGNALALLELRAHRKIIFEKASLNEVYRDTAVIDALQLFFVPIYEGMALFHEFDVLPGNSRVISKPSLWAARIFQSLVVDKNVNKAKSKKGPDYLDGILESLMFAYRNSDTALSRKINVLMQPLQDDPHFYLSGYLTVKAIWRLASQKTELFWDKELFISYLHSWLFYDRVLIEFICDEDIPPEVLISHISRRLQRRLAVLVNEDLTEEVRSFEDIADGGSGSGRPIFSNIRLSEADADIGYQAFMRLMRQTLEGVGDRESKKNILFGDLATLEHRSKFMRLAIEPVFIEVNENKRVNIYKDKSLDSLYMSGPAPKGAIVGVTRGWVAVYFSSEDMKIYTLACRKGRAMLWMPPSGEVLNDQNEEWPVILTKFIGIEEARQKTSQAIRKSLLASKDCEYKSLLARVKQHTSEVFSNLSLQTILEPSDVSRVSHLIQRRGFYDLLHKDGDLLSCLAQLSVLPISGRDNLKRLEDNYEEPLFTDSKIEKLKEISSMYNFPFVVENSKYLYYLV